MWQLEPTTQWEKDIKYYAKKRPRELAAVFRNLERYQAQLKLAANSKAVIAGYLHSEPMGVVAIDQKGGGPNLQETRLYTYADDDKKLIYLITLGNKESQNSDITLSKEFVESLRQNQSE